MALSTQDLWQKFSTAMADYITGGSFDPSSQAICFAGNTLNVDLDNADPEISNNNIFQIGNCIPKNSPLYAPAGDLIGSYASFLNYIDLGGSANPNLDSQINIAAAALSAAQSNFLTQVSAAVSGWNSMKQAMPTMTFSQYLTNYGAVYQAAKLAVDGAQSKYTLLMQQKYGTNYQTLLNAQNVVAFSGGARDTVTKNAYNMFGKVGAVAPLGSATVLPGQVPSAPASTLTEILLPSYNLPAFSTAYQQWQINSVNNVVGATIEVNGNSKASNFSDYGWSTSADGSVFGDFIGITASGSASSSTVKDQWDETTFDLKVSYTGLQSFKIDPGMWFELSMLNNYQNKLLPGAPNFFGAGGSLSLLPYEIIVGFEPAITLTLNNQDYNDVKTHFEAQGTTSIDIGPFSIGSASYSTYSDTNNMTYNDSTCTITIPKVPSSLPILVGVICSKIN